MTRPSIGWSSWSTTIFGVSRTITWTPEPEVGRWTRSKAMRRILIDYARRRSALKRGGPLVRVPLREDAEVVEAEVIRMLSIDEALRGLEQHDARMGRIVECRFFGGMSVADTAQAVGASTRTVEREWARARAYLQEALQ